MPHFGEMLAEIRQDYGLTQKELAEKLHLASSSISNYETGQRNPDADFVCSAADFFNVSADYILGRVDSNLPLELMNQTYLGSEKVSSVIDKLLALDERRRETLIHTLNDMSICAKINSQK